jgi:ribosomal protein S18 acetylase RimI-like enzyme
MKEEQRSRIQSILETDRGWAAYALADLDPSQDACAHWLVARQAVVLRYTAFAPPVLFVHGSPEESERLLGELPGGDYLYTLLGIHRAPLLVRMQIRHEAKMWRMVLRRESFTPRPMPQAMPLGAADLKDIEALFGDHPDRPDAFAASQLEDGFFFGLRQSGRLVSLAGTHVVSQRFSVAAVGNVFTLPEARRQGFGTEVTAAVVEALLGAGVRTIALNVAQENERAIRSYRSLGFWPFVGYYEGTCRLEPAPPGK